MFPTHDGRYIAQPKDWTVQESGEHKIPTFVCQFELSQFLGQNGWEYVNDLQITGYFYLFKKDGKVNTNTVESLKASLGWDGRSITKLAELDWAQSEVQLSLGSEVYDGKARMKVKYINPRDWTPAGIDKDPQVVQSLESKYGAQLRAIAGPVKTTEAAPSGPNGGKQDVIVQTARRKAWEAFQKKHPGKTADDITEVWRAAIKAVIPDRPSSGFAGADWMKVQASIEAPANPVSEEQQFKEEDIPF